MKKWRLLRKCLSATLAACVLLVGVFVGNVFVNAAELAGFQDLSVVCFKNVYSGKYLTVHNGENTNHTNVYQSSSSSYDATYFKLQYNVTNDCYRISAECSRESTTRYLHIAANNTVQIFTTNAPDKQQWQFYYYGNGRFAIVSNANHQLALTVRDTSSGSNTATSVGSPGNVYLYPLQTTSSSVSVAQLWEIEEYRTEPAISMQLIDDGYYKFENEYDKYMDVDSDTHNVFQHSYQNETSQIWETNYVNAGYYTIRSASNPNRVLCVSDNFDEIGSNIITAELGTNAYPASHMMWKIIPNADGFGSYRLVSLSSGNNQVVTVVYDDADGANIAQVDYVNAPSQRWTLSLATCPSYGYPDHAEGHVLELDNNRTVPRYECALCDARFYAPEYQDQFILSTEDRITVFALQQAALLKSLESNKSNFIEACFHAIDKIRSQYSNYELCYRSGEYMSPYRYVYTGSTINANIDITTITYTTTDLLTRSLVWTALGELPYPYNLVADNIKTYMMTGETYSTADLLSFHINAIKDELIQKLSFGDPCLEVAISTIMFGMSVIQGMEDLSISLGDVAVEIVFSSDSAYDTFVGKYSIQNQKIAILDENYTVRDRAAPNLTTNQFCHTYNEGNSSIRYPGTIC